MGYYDGHSVLHSVGFVLESEYLYFMGANGEVSAHVVKDLPDSPPPCAPLILSSCLPTCNSSARGIGDGGQATS